MGEEVTTDLGEVLQKIVVKVAEIFGILVLFKDVQTFEVLEKRRVDHCLVSMEGLAEGQAGARLACGEVAAAISIYILDRRR